MIMHPDLQLQYCPKSLCSVTNLEYGIADTPAGSCLIAIFENQLVWLSFVGTKSPEQQLNALQAHFPAAVLKESTHAALFLQDKSTLNCLLVGTPFQLEVWKALVALKAGTTTHYESLAKSLNIPLATRAVANAIGANPISWFIPCHRVLRKDGSWGGYRWGLDVKRALLNYENTYTMT